MKKFILFILILISYCLVSINKHRININHLNTKHITKKIHNDKYNLNTNTISSDTNIDKDDLYKSMIDKQKKINNLQHNTSKVIIRNGDGTNELSYGYTITYSGYSKSGDNINNIKKNVDGTTATNYNLGSDNDLSASTRGQFIPTNDIFNIKVHINTLNQSNTSVHLSETQQDLIRLQEIFSSYKKSHIYYSIEATGILTCPSIKLYANCINNDTGKSEKYVVGEYGVYNFYTTSGNWAISLAQIVLPIIGSITLFHVIGGILTLKHIIGQWSELCRIYGETINPEEIEMTNIFNQNNNSIDSINHNDNSDYVRENTNENNEANGIEETTFINSEQHNITTHRIESENTNNENMSDDFEYDIIRNDIIEEINNNNDDDEYIMNEEEWENLRQRFLNLNSDNLESNSDEIYGEYDEDEYDKIILESLITLHSETPINTINNDDLLSKTSQELIDLLPNVPERELNDNVENKDLLLDNVNLKLIEEIKNDTNFFNFWLESHYKRVRNAIRNYIDDVHWKDMSIYDFNILINNNIEGIYDELHPSTLREIIDIDWIRNFRIYHKEDFEFEFKLSILSLIVNPFSKVDLQLSDIFFKVDIEIFTRIFFMHIVTHHMINFEEYADIIDWKDDNPEAFYNLFFINDKKIYPNLIHLYAIWKSKFENLFLAEDMLIADRDSDEIIYRDNDSDDTNVSLYHDNYDEDSDYVEMDVADNAENNYYDFEDMQNINPELDNYYEIMSEKFNSGDLMLMSLISSEIQIYITNDEFNNFLRQENNEINNIKLRPHSNNVEEYIHQLLIHFKSIYYKYEFNKNPIYSYLTNSTHPISNFNYKLMTNCKWIYEDFEDNSCDLSNYIISKSSIAEIQNICTIISIKNLTNYFYIFDDNFDFPESVENFNTAWFNNNNIEILKILIDERTTLNKISVFMKDFIFMNNGRIDDYTLLWKKLFNDFEILPILLDYRALHI